MLNVTTLKCGDRAVEVLGAKSALTTLHRRHRNMVPLHCGSRLPGIRSRNNNNFTTYALTVTDLREILSESGDDMCFKQITRPSLVRFPQILGPPLSIKL